VKKFEWTDDLETGVAIIDRQHQQYARFVNAFLQLCMRSTDVRPDLEKAFNFLYAYAREHLTTEERLMEEFDYPDRETHVKLHDYLRSWTEQAREHLGAGDLPDDFVMRINYVLVDWFQEHIKRTDRKLTDWLRRIAEEQRTPRIVRLVKGLFSSSEGGGKKDKTPD